MIVELISGTTENDYSEYIASKEHSMFSASLLFRDFILQLSPSSIPFYYIAKDESGKVCGTLSSFVFKGKYGAVLNSMPWYGSNPGILSDSPEAFYALLDAFHKTAEWTGCVTSTIVTNPFDKITDYQEYYNPLNSKYKVHIAHRQGLVTELPEYNENFETELFKLFSSKTRNQVRKGMKNVRVVKISKDLSDNEKALHLSYLKRVHQENMKMIRSPVFKDKEFDIFSQWGFGEHLNLFITLNFDNDEKTTSALLLKYFNKTVDYLVPTVESTYRDLCPTHHSIFKAMVDAAKNGYKYWNWGGTIKETMPGVYHFKKGFGATERDYQYFTHIFNDDILNVSKEELVEEYPFFYVLPFNLVSKWEDE